MRQIIASLALLGGLVWSKPATALISLEAMLGSRSVDVKSSGTTTGTDGTGLKAALHIDPIPLIPVSFGLGLAKTTTDSTSTLPGGDGLEAALEIKGWLPFVPFVTPYARLSIIAAGIYVFDGTINGVRQSLAYDISSGTGFGIGVEWAPIPLIGVMAEYAFGSFGLEPSEIELNGVKQSGVPDADLDYSEFLVGVSFGF